MSWFCVLKRFLGSEQPQKGSRRSRRKTRRRWIFMLLKLKRLAPLSDEPPRSPSSSSSPKKTLMVIPTTHELAAIKIQAAFRGYLAREALRGLKGVVSLQALVRGWTVRKQTMDTLKCLQSIVNLQLQVCAKTSEGVAEIRRRSDEFYSQWFGEKDINVDLNIQHNRDVPKNAQRDKAMTQYFLTHRRSAETEREKIHSKQRYWLEQWVDAQLARSESKRQQQQLQRHARHRRQRSTGDDIMLTGSPSLPAYMAATESAKAKTRSTSTPRNRNLSFDVCSEITSPYTYGKVSPVSSVNSEMITTGFARSPGLKGVKTNMSPKGHFI